MSYYNTCEHCGAALDPGERCDCRKARIASIKNGVREAKIRKNRALDREITEYLGAKSRRCRA